jgi:hypothetical protein
MPTKRFFSASMAWCGSGLSPSPPTNPSASPTLRADNSNPASTSSFTALALAPGALNTGMPRSVMAGTGMLLVPAPARATARTDVGMSSLCMSAERSSTASGASSLSATS